MIKSGDFERLSVTLAAMPPPLVDSYSRVHMSMNTTRRTLAGNEIGISRSLPGQRYSAYKTVF
jgi:hypothetical protein